MRCGLEECHTTESQSFERRIGVGQLGRHARSQPYSRGGRALGGERQHALARVEAVHRAGRADALGDLRGKQPWPGTDVEGILAGPRIEDVEDRAALGDDVRRAVGGFDAGGKVGVERKGHDVLLSSVLT
jgi:hypothetical protein